MTEYPKQYMTTDQLKLGDVVKTFDGPFDTAIVSKIGPDSVKFYRPYGTKADFSYTGGVICYMGLEEFSRPITDKGTWFVWQRDELK